MMVKVGLGGSMVLASVRSGLYWVNFPLILPATSCLPLGDQLIQDICPGATVVVSYLDPSDLTKYMAN